MGRYAVLSPSQVKTASGETGCFMKWALGRLLPKLPDGEAQAEGHLLHEVQQRYLTDGVRQDVIPADRAKTEEEFKLWRKVGHMALAGMPFMPGPGKGGVEGAATVTVSGITYSIALDWQGPAHELPGVHQLVASSDDLATMPACVDHKTSADPSQYGQWGKEAFLADPQALIYAIKLMVQHRVRRVFLRWIYYWKKLKSKALPSDCVVTWEEVEEAFGRLVHPIAVEMVDTLATMPQRAKSPDEIVERAAFANETYGNRREPLSCEKMGGCEYRPYPWDSEEPDRLAKKGKVPGPYRGLCKLSEAERARACLSGLNETKIVSAVSLVRSPKPVRTKIENDSGVCLNVREKDMPDLFAALQGAKKGAPLGASKPEAPASEAPATDASNGKTPDLAAALRGKKPAAAADPVNPPEKPAVTLPAQGADLQAHLKAKGAAEHVRTEAQPKDVGAAAKRPSARPDVGAERSKAKLDGFLAAVDLTSRDGLAYAIAAHLAPNLAMSPDQVVDRAYQISDRLLKERG